MSWVSQVGVYSLEASGIDGDDIGKDGLEEDILSGHDVPGALKAVMESWYATGLKDRTGHCPVRWFLRVLSMLPCIFTQNGCTHR